jgi:predicted secreted protein
MQLNVITLVAMYLTIWWTALFAILPLGLRSHAETGVEVPRGCEPGAPVKLDLKRKAITTTWVSMIIFVLMVAIIESGWIHLPQLGSH